MDRERAAFIAVGGAAGATVRWATISHAFPLVTGFPWPVFLINVLGSALLAAAIVEARRRPNRRSLLVDGLGVGFAGGLTTFSTFALEIVELQREGEAAVAVTYLVASVVAGGVAAWGAARLQRRLATDGT